MFTMATRMFLSRYLQRHNTRQSLQSLVYLQQCNLSIKPEIKIQDNGEKEVIDPLKHPDYFNVYDLFTVKTLFDAGVHYGHKETSLDENMKTFLFGSRLGYLIFDLDQTAELLREALNFTAHIAYREGIILFISKNPQFTYLVEKTAKDCKEYAYTRAWRYGLFTNSRQLFGTAVRLPDLCIFLNTLDNVSTQHPAVIEAANMCIPTIGIVDSNCNPNLITYPIPGNDDTLRSAELYCSLFRKAIERGKNAKKWLRNSGDSTKATEGANTANTAEPTNDTEVTESADTTNTAKTTNITEASKPT